MLQLFNWPQVLNWSRRIKKHSRNGYSSSLNHYVKQHREMESKQWLLSKIITLVTSKNTQKIRKQKIFRNFGALKKFTFVKIKRTKTINSSTHLSIDSKYIFGLIRTNGRTSIDFPTRNPKGRVVSQVFTIECIERWAKN